MLENYKLMIEEGISEIGLPEQPAQLYEPIRYILRIGGKRIRPVLVLLGAELYGEKYVEEALPAALAVELFHNFTLMHDDIMDDAPLRRGVPTVHEKWNTNVAILSGDNLLILAYQELAKVGADRVPLLLPIFNQMAREVCEGQQWDMEYEKHPMIDQAAYLEMIRLKTAVLLGNALKMGAIVGGASAGDAAHLYDFGVSLGIAFQLQDDILDVYGDPTNFGKQVGGDILANKKTILLITAFAQASDVDRQALESWSAVADNGETNLAGQKIDAIRQIYDRAGVREAAEQLKETYIRNAFECLHKLRVSTEKLDKLRVLAQSLLTRNH